MNKFEVLAGRHQEGGETYKKGETFFSAENWAGLFPEKYRLVGAAPAPVLQTPAARKAARVVETPNPNPEPEEDVLETKQPAPKEEDLEQAEVEDEEEEQMKRLSQPKKAPAAKPKGAKKKSAKAKDGFA